MDKSIDRLFVCAASGTMLTLIEQLLGNIDRSFTFLCLVMVLDFITGILCGIEQKSLSSNICIKGLFKKLFVFVYVIIGHHLDILLGTDYVRMGICYMYAIGEVLSIIENGVVLGVPVPTPIKKALEILNGGDDDEY